AVLPALDGEATAEQRRRGRAEVDVARVQPRLVGRRPVLEQLAGVRRQLEHAVAPVRLAVPSPVAGRDEELAAAGLYDDAGTRPDRRVALRARGRLDDRVPVAAERVPD